MPWFVLYCNTLPLDSHTVRIAKNTAKELYSTTYIKNMELVTTGKLIKIPANVQQRSTDCTSSTSIIRQMLTDKRKIARSPFTKGIA